MPFEPGQRVAGKYRIECLLGQGGMGVVLAARHLTLDRSVALKVMRPDKNHEPEMLQRFLREARAAGRLHGPHVARVMDADRMPDGSPYIVMELLQGEDLRRRLRRAPRPSTQEAVDLAIQVCDALAEAHAAGIVHRDIKPENLFLTSGLHGETTLKVLDFGISKLSDAEEIQDEGLTSENVAIGSRSYMSPEQMRSSRQVDHRTDLWSLGVTLFELLAGTLPFTQKSSSELSAAVLRDKPPSLRERRRGIPRALEAVVLRCLRKEPSERFPDASALALALAPFASAEGRKLAADIATEPSRRSVSPGRHVAPEASGPVSSAIDETAVTGQKSAVSTDPSAETTVVPDLRPSRRIAVGAATTVALAAALALGVGLGWPRGASVDGAHDAGVSLTSASPLGSAGMNELGVDVHDLAVDVPSASAPSGRASGGVADGVPPSPGTVVPSAQPTAPLPVKGLGRRAHDPSQSVAASPHLTPTGTATASVGASAPAASSTTAPPAPSPAVAPSTTSSTTTREGLL